MTHVLMKSTEKSTNVSRKFTKHNRVYTLIENHAGFAIEVSIKGKIKLKSMLFYLQHPMRFSIFCRGKEDMRTSSVEVAK